jgi:hypothetical protein
MIDVMADNSPEIDISGPSNPEKYIRTFASDMETFKKGGVPDLAPLPTAPAAETEAQKEAPPPPPALAPPPAPPEAPAEPELPTVEEKVQPAPRSTSGTLQTYAGDFSERMKSTHATTATILAAEQDAAPFVPHTEEKKSSQSGILYSVAAVILIIAGGAGAYIAYTRYLVTEIPVLVAPVVSSPIFVDEREKISGTGDALLLAIQESVANSLKPNTVRMLYLATTTNEAVFTALPLSTPSVVLRNVNAEGSIAGVVNVSGNQSPFFILSVTSYGATFAGMLSWEKIMPRSVIKLYPPYPVTTPSVTASTTPSTTAPSTPAGAAGFIDATVANHDVRAYRDAAGRDVFMYGYWNQTTLVIARDAAAFTEILQRLATSRAK